jgi:DNA-binding NarL/FixJ family response regulator
MSQQKNNPTLRRVAIVEDDSGLRDQLQKILKSAPGVCCVGTFSSGEKALEGMVALQPDVILMDINLPGMSGIQCVSRLRNDLSAAHVIMLTVYEDSERIFQALQAGSRRIWSSRVRPMFASPLKMSTRRGADVESHRAESGAAIPAE